MEQPIDDTDAAFHDAQATVLGAVRELRPDALQRGQYLGYRAEDGVATESTTETYVAAELYIDTPRWAGVPFRVRTGKRLAESVTEAVAIFKRPGRHSDADGQRVPDLVHFRFGHADGVTISLQAKQPGDASIVHSVSLNVDFDDAIGPRQDAYERVLDDVMNGRRRRFVRWSTVEQEWRIVAPVLDLPTLPALYEPRSWGPRSGGPLSPDRWQKVGSVAQTTHRGDLNRADASGEHLAV